MEKTINFSELTSKEQVKVSNTIDANKRLILSGKLVDIMFENEGNLATYNPILFEIVAKVLLFDAYSCINFGEALEKFEDIFAIYDKLGELDIKLECFCRDSDISDFAYSVEKMLNDKINAENSVANVLASALNKAVEKIPKLEPKEMDGLIKSLGKQLNKIKPENLAVLKQAMSPLQ